jgi:hypothetical protein
MPAGFKGTTVFLRSVTVAGKATGLTIEVSVQFCDSEGVVHAITRHELEPTVDPRIASTVRPFLDALKSWVERLHYNDIDELPKQVTPGGIAESLRGSPDPDDDPLGQG